MRTAGVLVAIVACCSCMGARWQSHVIFGAKTGGGAWSADVEGQCGDVKPAPDEVIVTCTDEELSRASRQRVVIIAAVALTVVGIVAISLAVTDGDIPLGKH